MPRTSCAGVDHPSLGVLYDTHHMHIEAKSVGDTVRMLGSDLRHVHASENDRGTPGTGQVRWDETMSALKGIGFDGWLMIEAFSRTDPDFANLIHVWRDFDPIDEIWGKGGQFLRQAWEAAPRAS